MKWSNKENEVCVEAFFKYVDFDVVKNTLNSKLMIEYVKKNIPDFFLRTEASYQFKLNNIDSCFRQMFDLNSAGMYGGITTVKPFVTQHLPQTQFKTSNKSDFKQIWFKHKEQNGKKELLKLQELVDKKIKQYIGISEMDKIKDEDNFVLSKVRNSGSQQIWKNALMAIRGENVKCDISNCKIKNKNILIASHIKPYSVCKPIEKFSIENGLILCPNHDKLFDKGYLSFSTDGQLIINYRILNENDFFNLGINIDSKISVNNKVMSDYLNFHNKNVYKE